MPPDKTENITFLQIKNGEYLVAAYHRMSYLRMNDMKVLRLLEGT